MNIVKNEKGCFSPGPLFLLILPALWMSESLYGLAVLWILILWFPLSIMLLIKLRKKTK